MDYPISFQQIPHLFKAENPEDLEGSAEDGTPG